MSRRDYDRDRERFYGRDRDRDRDRGGYGRRSGGGGGGGGGGGSRGGGAAHLANVFGSEDDKVNCPFYFKIGACRHGERCSRKHIKPFLSETVMVPHMYVRPPPGADGLPVEDFEHFENFYEEIMDELSNYGPVEELNVLENMGDHLIGNVYVKYTSEEGGEKCCTALRGRYYGGQMLMPEFAPVTNFREARCRDFDEGHCKRGDYCNFMHIRRVPKHLRKKLRKLRRKAEERERSESRSRSRSRRRRKDGDKSRSRERSRRKKKHDNEVARASNSEERRKMIAMWNTKKDDPKDEKQGDSKEDTKAPPPDDSKEPSAPVPAAAPAPAPAQAPAGNGVAEASAPPS